jgi:hypothetical protein
MTSLLAACVLTRRACLAAPRARHTAAQLWANPGRDLMLGRLPDPITASKQTHRRMCDAVKYAVVDRRRKGIRGQAAQRQEATGAAPTPSCPNLSLTGSRALQPAGPEVTEGRTGATCSPRCGSTRQTRTTLSAPPEARYRPCRLKASAQMTPVCAAISCPGQGHRQDIGSAGSWSDGEGQHECHAEGSGLTKLHRLLGHQAGHEAASFCCHTWSTLGPLQSSRLDRPTYGLR